MNQIDAIQNILGKAAKSKITKSVDRHVWTIAEENLVMDLYFGKSGEKEINEVVEKTELKYTSVKMKLQNIQFLDKGVGLERVSTLTRSIYNQRVRNERT